MTLIMKDIKKITGHLDGIKPAQPNLDSDLPVTVKEAVEILAPKLRHMKAQGFTLPELTAALAEHGLIVKPNTLSRYLAQNQEAPLNRFPKKRRTDKAKASSEPGATELNSGSSPAAAFPGNPGRPTETGRPESPPAHPRAG